MAFKISGTTVIDDSRQFLPVTISAGSTIGIAGSVLTSTGTGVAWAEGGATTVAITTFTASGTFTKNSKDIYYKIEAWGAGGGGAKWGNNTDYGEPFLTFFAGGGGGGAYVFRELPATSIGSSLTITVGAGGASVGNGVSVADGNNGGNTTVDGGGAKIGIFTAFAGSGGIADFERNTNTRIGGGGGGGWGGSGEQSSGFCLGGAPKDSLNIRNTDYYGGGTDLSGGLAGAYRSNSFYGGGAGVGIPSGHYPSSIEQAGFFGSGTNVTPNVGHSVYGGGGGGAFVWNPTGYRNEWEVRTTIGGRSVYGGNGGIGNTNSPGTNGVVPGGGGGATGSEILSDSSGAGADGMVVITAFRR